jgi:hypothetical protein
LQTTGKTLEEIDLLFATPEVKESMLAQQTVHRHYDIGKEDIRMLEKV